MTADRNWSWQPSTWEFALDLGTGWGMFSGDELVGTAIVTPFPEMAAISGVLVLSRFGRQGVGRRLMEHLLDSGSQVLYATSYGQPLYERLGFHSVGQSSTHSGTFTGAPSGATRRATADDLPSIVALDAAASGLSREAMWKRLLTAGPVLVSPAGVVAARRLGEKTQIGPLIAASPDDACALIADIAAGAGTVKLDLEDPEVMAFAGANGLTANGGCALMVRNAPGVPGDRSRYFAPVSLALG